jgi:hypothetical protein
MWKPFVRVRHDHLSSAARWYCRCFLCTRRPHGEDDRIAADLEEIGRRVDLGEDGQQPSRFRIPSRIAESGRGIRQGGGRGADEAPGRHGSDAGRKGVRFAIAEEPLKPSAELVPDQCAQPHRPEPHEGAAGIDDPLDRPDATPTIPGVESSFARFVPWQMGHAALRSAVTSASNGLQQSLHSYS